MGVDDTARWAFAVLILALGPPAILYWYAIHPFAPTWRRLGPRPTFWIVGTGYVALAAALVWKRDQLLGRDLGGSLPLALVGLVFYLAAVWLTVRTRRVLPFNVLAGVPEVSADAPGGLITEGVYAHVRHPRYASVILAVIGFALMVNYVGIFILTAFLVAAVLGLIPMEERELAGRFGDQYERYRERVPMLVPRLGSRAREPGGGLP